MSLSVYFPVRVLPILTSIASHDMKLICNRDLTHHKDNSLIRDTSRFFTYKTFFATSLFLGFEYFNANYFSDLNIYVIFAAVIQQIMIMAEYIARNIDSELTAWKEDSMRKPLLLRGARQVGKSSAVKNFGKQFRYFAEVNFERNKAIKTFFQGDIDVRLIAKKISSYINVPIEAGKTLLFLDEIQECPEAIMS